MLGRLVAAVLSAFLGAVDKLPTGVQRWLFDREPGRRTTGMLWVIISGAIAVGVTSVIAVVMTNIPLQTGSSTVMRYTALVATSTYTYVVLAVIIGHGPFLYRHELMASMTAKNSQLRKNTVKLLAKESRSTDGTTRAIVPRTFDIDEAKEEIRAALDTGEHRTLDHASKSQDGGTEPAHERETPGVSGGETPVQVLGGGKDSDTPGNTGDSRSTPSSAKESIKLWLLDTQSALNYDDVLWNAVVPGGFVSMGILIALQIWVHPIVYPAIIAAGVVVGTANLYRVRRKRLRELDRLRAGSGTPAQNWVSVLVKAVETPETTVYMAWVGGRRYASIDKAEFIHGVAARAIEYAAGETQTPTYMERFQHYVAMYRPLYRKLRDEEKARILKELKDKTPPEKIVPRAVLLDDVIRRDGGKWNPEKQYGHDPELVRDVYQDLVPMSLVEDDIDGVTGVRRRNSPVPHGDSGLFAAFSGTFTNISDTYDIDVDQTADGGLPPLEPRVIDDE